MHTWNVVFVVKMQTTVIIKAGCIPRTLGSSNAFTVHQRLHFWCHQRPQVFTLNRLTRTVRKPMGVAVAVALHRQILVLEGKKMV